MQSRHSKLTELFRALSGKVDAYTQKHAEACLEENESDPAAFYECIKSNTSGFSDNLYKFENLSLYADLREKQCRASGEDYEKCVQKLVQDVKAASEELEASLE